jgi:hypothetical protein
MASTASERMVFVLGKEIHGNRQVLIVEDGEEYDLDADDAVEYGADENDRFPYEL